MSIIKLKIREHIYYLDLCAGCRGPIEGYYTEIGLPNEDGKQIHHIALCLDCDMLAKGLGIV